MTYKVLTPYLLLLIIIQITVMEKCETPENLFPEEKQRKVKEGVRSMHSQYQVLKF